METKWKKTKSGKQKQWMKQIEEESKICPWTSCTIWHKDWIGSHFLNPQQHIPKAALRHGSIFGLWGHFTSSDQVASGLNLSRSSQLLPKATNKKVQFMLLFAPICGILVFFFYSKWCYFNVVQYFLSFFSWLLLFNAEISFCGFVVKTNQTKSST